MISLQYSLLLIDDEPHYRAFLRAQLGGVYRLTETSTLFAGLAELRGCSSGGIHCVLLDLCLPDSSPELTVLRVRDVAHAIPLLVISGDGRPATIAAAMHAGADGFAIKGREDLEPAELVRSISLAVRHRKILNTLDTAIGETAFLRRAFT